MGELPLLELPPTENPEDARWARRGAREVDRVRRALGTLLCAAHHLGETSLPGAAGPAVLDVLAEVEAMERLASARLRLLVHGFEVCESASPDCRLYVVDDLVTGERRVELRCYERGHREAEEAPALFALLRARPDLARAWRAHKAAMRAVHAGDAYDDAKRAWRDGVLAEALALWRAR